jgi:hypothetical protein
VENTHRLWDTTVKKIPTSCGSLVSIDRSWLLFSEYTGVHRIKVWGWFEVN